MTSQNQLNKLKEAMQRTPDRRLYERSQAVYLS